ncbi:prephenate dehydrogenase/arogenate dehydrogenase family protein [bacterium]|nr:prephenate dehydrogenase/arogenate dehydrogenase family protein [bacterium]MBU1983415.1 prephenate dehydrogenase/arogenate dehydrogenase family protein [bacterium]
MVEDTQESVSESLGTLTLPSPLELLPMEFRRTAIVGVGLIGGSIGLRMKAMEYAGILIGHDDREVLNAALACGAIDRGAGDLAEAVAEADLVVLAVPEDQIAVLLPTILRTAKDGALVTDTGATKGEAARAAGECRNARAVYVGGHPLAGSNRQGIANADGGLFENSYWLLTPGTTTPPQVRESLAWWVRLLGAYPLILEPELHDRIMAMTTHVPFMIALALSRWLAERSEEISVLPRLATGNFQTITGMAALPLSVWEAVIRSNRTELGKSLDQFIEVLQRCGTELREDRLADAWQQAHQFQRRLSRDRPGDWDANCELAVTVPDRPGTIARIAGLLASFDINIRDIHMLYIRERHGGTMRVIFETRTEARQAMEILLMHGYTARLKE